MSIYEHAPPDDIEEIEPLEAWVEIQCSTFTNWVNEKLRPEGIGVSDVRRDFRDGQKLCILMRILTRKALHGRIISSRKKDKELNHYEASGNLALALETMEKDGVRLVNIGAEDIRSGNLKLILGMIWTLIRKYQIGSSGKSLPKKLMLEWINAVLHPHLTVYNFSTDWNDGKALQGVIEWCQPGTFPHWMDLNRSDPEKNCRDAIETAERLFGVPMVVSPKHFSSPDLDELSGMTYISYFMHEGHDGVREMGKGQRSCGYEATLNWANSWLMNVAPESRTTNFDVDWNDGFRACALIEALKGSGTIPGFPNINRNNWAYACEMAILEAEKSGIPRFLNPHDMADPKVDHLGPMAYVAWHRKIELERPKEPTPPPTPTPVPVPVVIPEPEPEVSAPPPPPPPPPVPVVAEPEPEPEPVQVPVVVPVPPVHVYAGPPEVDVTCPPQWRANSTYTIMADTHRAGSGAITATCTNPSGHVLDIMVRKTDDDKFDIPFNPHEKGRHVVRVYHNEQEVRESPFTINVYDVSYGKIIRHAFGPIQLKEPYMFQVETGEIGYDDLDIYIMHSGKKQQFDLRNNGNGNYDVRFFPQEIGVFNVQVYCGGEQLPGSPFDLEACPKGNVVARGEGLRQAFTRRTARFEVDTAEFRGQTMEVKLFSPSGRMLRVDVNRLPSNPDVYVIEYFPDEIGTHQVEIFYSDGPIPGCPFYVNVREPQVYVRNLENRAVRNRQAHFLIDATEFKEGTIEIDSALPVMKYEKVGDKLYEVTMLPQKSGHFDLIIGMDGKQCRGSPFDVDVMDE